MQDPATVARVGFVKTLKFIPKFITTSESSDFFVSRAHHILADIFAKFTDAGNTAISGYLMAKSIILREKNVGLEEAYQWDEVKKLLNQETLKLCYLHIGRN